LTGAHHQAAVVPAVRGIVGAHAQADGEEDGGGVRRRRARRVVVVVGASREFTAQRDGRLFLGVNEGNLGDNSGTYDVTVEAEAVTNSGRP
jgi:hypothetical protein